MNQSAYDPQYFLYPVAAGGQAFELRFAGINRVLTSEVKLQPARTGI